MNSCIRYLLVLLSASCTLAQWQCSDTTSKCYQVVAAQSTSWANARSACQHSATGANLASIHSVEENQFITSLLPASGSTWIGGIRQDATTFRWTDGTHFVYSNFALHEPDNDNGVENCLEIYNQNDSIEYESRNFTWTRGQWNDYPCTINCGNDVQCPVAYVCEVASPPPDQETSTAANQESTTHQHQTTISQTTQPEQDTSTTVSFTNDFTTNGQQRSTPTPAQRSTCANMTCFGLPDGDYNDPVNPCTPYFFKCSGGFCYEFLCPPDIFGQSLYFDSVSDSCLERDDVAAC